MTRRSAGRSGSDEFVKQRAPAPAGFFRWEAAGLRWLGEGTGSGGSAVVGVRDVGERFIVLDRVEQTPATPSAARAFGRSLAATHALGAEAFGAGPPGWSGDGYIGRQSLTLQHFSTWGEFFANARLLPFARAARDAGNLSQPALASVERVCARLVQGEFDDTASPSRIHGDLWGGNVLYAAGGVVLIDPAAHGGHGLTDLAMLALFGSEHLDAVVDSYAEGARLEAGWRKLVGLHQLHPLLVHAVSHGADYGRRAGSVAARYA